MTGQSENELIASAHRDVRTQLESGTFDIDPYLRALELLERLGPTDSCDARIQLACDVCEGLGLAERPALCVETMRAAMPPGSKTSDPRAERRWHLNMGGFQLHTGDVASAVRHLAISYELASRQRDHLGLAGTWIALSALAAGAGQYEDAIRYADLIMKNFDAADGEMSSGFFPRVPIAAYVNRGNAHFRLDRLDQASADYGRAIALCGDRDDAWSVAAHVSALCALAEVWILRGELHLAGTLLGNAEALAADASAVPTASLNVRRVRAQLLVYRGQKAGLGVLESLLEDAERTYGAASYDGEVMDTLFALERAYRFSGDATAANKHLTVIASKLRVNSERALAIAAGFPSLPIESRGEQALRQLSALKANRERTIAALSSAREAASSSLEQLIALCSSACAIEEPSGEHGIRVAELCRNVSVLLGLDDETVQVAECAGLVHDVGKSGVPSRVLRSAQPLTDHEQQLLDDHAEYGSQLIHRTTIPGGARIAEAVRLHHQRFDGKGSAVGNLGASMPIEARILTACDHFDALITGRPRQPPLSVQTSLSQMFKLSGSQYDPHVIEALIETVRQILRTEADLIEYLGRKADSFGYTAARRKIRAATQFEAT